MFSAFRALRANWLRSTLTMLGIVIGVLAIVTLVAVLQGVKSEISRQVEGLGANLVLVVPGKLDESGQPNPMAMMGVSALTDRDVSALSRVPGVAQISPVLFIAGNIEKAGGESVSALVVATNRAGIEMNPTPIAEGRYFLDSEAAEHVCVLADGPRVAVFGTGPALGREIRVHGIGWKVVGVLGKPKSSGTLGGAMMGLSNLIYLPDTAARQAIPGGQINRIVLRTDYRHPAGALLRQLDNVVRAQHSGHEDYGMITQEKGLAMVTNLLTMAQSLLALIAGISLFVAGVGIMNIMLVTVTERTREIGIRKTVGARRRDIFQQFLTESVVLSLVGGVMGVVLSAAVCWAVARFTPLTPKITGSLVASALTVCTTVGVLFGVAPAIRAGRLSPIDALRHE